MWGILCVLSRDWCIRYRAAVLPRLVARPCERGILLEIVRRVLMIRRIGGFGVMLAAELVVVGLMAAEIVGGGIVVVALRERAVAAPPLLRLPVFLRGNVAGNISG